MILNNYIGTNISGTAVLGNGDDGIDLWRVTDHTISNNLVSGSAENGIQIGEATNSLITGNLIGVDASGTYMLGNGDDGINIWEGSYNTIGGGSVAERNLIGGSGDDGIDIGSDTVITGNVILNNYIGTNSSGTAVLGK